MPAMFFTIHNSIDKLREIVCRYDLLTRHLSVVLLFILIVINVSISITISKVIFTKSPRTDIVKYKSNVYQLVVLIKPLYKYFGRVPVPDHI